MPDEDAVDGLTQEETEVLKDNSDDEVVVTEEQAAAGEEQQGSTAEGGEPTEQVAQQQEPVAAAQTEGDEQDQPIDPRTTQLTEIETVIAGLGGKLDEGELSFTEYNTELNQLNNKRLEIALQMEREATLAAVDQRKHAFEWEQAQKDFFGDNDFYGQDQIRVSALDAAVKQAAQANEGKTYQEILAIADAQVKQSFGIKAGEEKSPSTTPQDIPNLQTLGDVTAGAANPMETKFSHLDGLDGVQLEQAVANMSDADQQRWAQA